MSIAGQCAKHLRVLKLNGCKNVTTECLVYLVKHCRKYVVMLLVQSVNICSPLDDVL